MMVNRYLAHPVQAKQFIQELTKHYQPRAITTVDTKIGELIQYMT